MAAFDLPFNNPELYSLLSNRRKMPAVAHPDLSTSSARPTIATSADTAHAVTSSSVLASLGTASAPTDVLLTLPPPLLRLLVVSAPFVQSLTTLSQLVTWTHPNHYAPFLLLCAWTALCLGGEYAARFGFNAIILAILGIGWVAKRGGKIYTTATAREKESHVRTLAIATSSQPAVQVLTPAALDALLHRASILSMHLQVLQKTISPIFKPFDWRDPALSFATVNLLLTSYPFYLLLTYFVPLRHIVLFFGLVLLTWEAPWLAVIRKSLWSSLLVRRTARLFLRILQGDLRLAQAEVKEGPKDIGLLARLRAVRMLSFDIGTAKGRSASPVPAGVIVQDVGSSLVSKEPESLEIQYLFTIFENQRWWIGLEWTQALLPNERPSWSDPTHAPSVPPGAFSLPSSTSTTFEGTTRTYTWKWLDPEWRIRGTAGVMISPSTIGANANPPVAAASTLPGSTKELKDAMGTLGDWKNKLSNRRDAEDTKERRGSSSSAISDQQSGSKHARSHSNAGSFFGDGLNALIGAKDGKPITKSDVTAGKAGEKPRSNSEASAQLEAASQRGDNEEEVPGHPTRLDESDAVHELDVADWTVDSQGWVFADNHWEKPSSKGGMGRYTRRRAWVRRAIVVEKLEVASASKVSSKKKD